MVVRSTGDSDVHTRTFKLYSLFDLGVLPRNLILLRFNKVWPVK